MRDRSKIAGLLALLLWLGTVDFSFAQQPKLPQLRLAVSTATPHNTPL